MQTFSIIILFKNGSKYIEPNFNNAMDARTYARTKVSYTGWNVRAVELRDDLFNTFERLWQDDWDDVSKVAGLYAYFFKKSA